MPAGKKPLPIDYDEFLPRLVDALRKAWQDVRRKRPGETFYLYGIGTDSDVVVMTPFCNTEENYAKTGNPDYPTDKWYAGNSLYGAGSKHTKALEDEVNRYVFEDHRGEPERLFEKRKARLLQVFEDALVQLDDEGFFGKGKKRHQVLVMIDRGDCSEEEWKDMLKVIKRINPPESTAPYLAALREQKKQDAARQRDKDREQGPIKEKAAAFLRLQKRMFTQCFSASRVSPASIVHLADLLPAKQTPAELWQVCFAAPGEPSGRLHGEGVIVVLVDPASGECAIEP